ncbi:MAG: FMN-binding negative transcriptional regulator [Bifidobacteriaceae bacterium]|nr:FMN-binding negative transcriptional regulator [Bifidobacteriaceae bacterium]
MQPNPDYEGDAVKIAKTLIADVGWATLVSHPPGRPIVASHYPVLLAPDDAVPVDSASGEAGDRSSREGRGGDGIVLLGHMCRPDAEDHCLGAGEMLVIVNGTAGYISPSWYGSGPAVPTWNYVTAHLSGVPERLSGEASLMALDRLVAHFERPVARPRLMRGTPADAEYAARVARFTVSFRLAVTRLDARVKLSQDKPREVRERIIEELDGSGPYANPTLAALMRRALQEEL